MSDRIVVFMVNLRGVLSAGKVQLSSYAMGLLQIEGGLVITQEGSKGRLHLGAGSSLQTKVPRDPNLRTRL